LTTSNPLRVLVLGGGAREHALIQALGRSPRAPELLCAPGNPGIAAEAETVALDLSDGAAVVQCAQVLGVSLVVVGPEAPLVAGVADALAEAGIPCFGPSGAAAQLEGSKAFCKEIMEAAGVPTAAYTVVTDPAAGMAAIEHYPVVIKADGLAAGKGVIIAADEAEARSALADLLVEHRFGTEQVVVEEFLEGEELSLLALCDGERAVALTATRGPTPAGWAPTHPSRPSTTPAPRRSAPPCTSRCSTSSRGAEPRFTACSTPA
jgi:phosphoribosylamine--glycine ligase